MAQNQVGYLWCKYCFLNFWILKSLLIHDKETFQLGATSSDYRSETEQRILLKNQETFPLYQPLLFF